MKLFGFELGSGNSVKDKLYWLVTGFMSKMGFVLWGGGSAPAPAPTTSTSYSTNVPEYAQPYVENMLNAAQAQIYNPSMTGFNAYTPYSTDPSNYVAGPAPMQQQAYSTAANMQVPGQYGLASAGTLGTSMGIGALGNQMGQAGNQYANQATNGSIGAYMNPYIQASLAPQLQLANQQYGIAGQQEQSNAAKSGAFGGSREALMNSLNQQNQMLAQNQIIGQGYNTAFNNAQQAQQFGANLGLQGQQAQGQSLASQLAAYNQLAGLGGQQLAAQQGIANQQNTFGQQQQTQQQNIINQAVQNYATAQQYPFMQLGLLNSMLRGLPMQQSSTQMYQAPPNPLGTALGLGALALGQTTKQKDGGVIKAAAGIPMNMYTKQELNSPYLSPVQRVVSPFIQQQQDRLQNNPQAHQVLSQPLQMPSPHDMAQAPQNRVGLDAIGTGNMVPPVSAAGGGLLAFVGGGDTSYDGANLPTPGPTSGMGIDPMTADPETLVRQQLLSSRPESDAAKAQREDLEASIKSRESQMDKDKWTMLGLNLLAQTGPFALTNVGNAGLSTMKYLSEQEDLTDKDRKELLKLAADQDKNELTRNDQLLTNLNTVKANKDTRMYQIDSLKIQKQTAENDKLLKTTSDAGKLWTDTLSKNLLNARTNAARNQQDISEAEAYRQAYEDTYNMMKDLPNFKLLGNMAAPEAAPVPPPPPPPEKSFGSKIGDFLSNAVGSGNVVHFDAQGNRIQ
jgi:hypothetical protein